MSNNKTHPKKMDPVETTTISFKDIVQGRDATVRVTSDKLIYAVDLVMVMTGKDRNQSGLVLRRLTDDLLQSHKLIDRQISKTGGHPTKLVSFQDALELVMVLPGKVAKETRTKFADIIKRYMGGDSSMVTELEANAKSTSPLAQMARGDNTGLEIQESHKRKLEELEIAERIEQLERIKTDRIKQTKLFELSFESKQIEMHNARIQAYEYLCIDKKIDDRARLVFKDSLLNMTGTQLLTNGDDTSNKPITLSTVASDMGLRLTNVQLQKAGLMMRKCYMEKYNKAPEKHEQFVDGAVRKVNSYTEKDKDMMENILKECAN